MLSINMRIFKTVLLIASFASVRCLPVTESTVGTTETKVEVTSLVPQEKTAASTTNGPLPTRADITDYYDQRQNGSENYRIHVDGVVLVFAPVEALLLAGAASTTEPNLSISNLSNASSLLSLNELTKPGFTGIQNKTDPAISKTINK